MYCSVFVDLSPHTMPHHEPRIERYYPDGVSSMAIRDSNLNSSDSSPDRAILERVSRSAGHPAAPITRRGKRFYEEFLRRKRS